MLIRLRAITKTSPFGLPPHPRGRGPGAAAVGAGRLRGARRSARRARAPPPDATRAPQARVQAVLAGTQGADYYGNDFGPLQLGVCGVTIPSTHHVGELETPWIGSRNAWFPRIYGWDASHVRLWGIQKPFGRQEYIAELKRALSQSRRKDLFIFVHGYANTFEDVCRRTAQVSHDLSFPGPVLFYSWPSAGNSLRYGRDEEMVTRSVENLAGLLVDLARDTGAEKLHILAHSLGSRLVLGALDKFLPVDEPSSRRIAEVIFAAPDVGRATFRESIESKLKAQRLAGRVTLYASSADRALAISRTYHGEEARAGELLKEPLLITGMDTVNSTDIDFTIWRHAYYGGRILVEDLGAVLRSVMASERSVNLEPATLNGAPYYFFKR
jgi:esterase/lipase superfamily enzyme